MHTCEISDLQLAHKFSPQEQVLFSRFLQSPQAEQRALNIIHHSRLHGLDRINYEQTLYGALWEDLGYLCLKDNLENGIFDQKLLSPAEVVKLYHFLHPDKRLITHYDLITSLEGINVPDGILLQKDKYGWFINNVYDFKIGNGSSSSKTAAKKQAEHYASSKALEKNLRLHTSQQSMYFGKVVHAIRSDIPPMPVSVADSVDFNYATPSDSDFNLGVGQKVPLFPTHEVIHSFVESLRDHYSQTVNIQNLLQAIA